MGGGLVGVGVWGGRVRATEGEVCGDRTGVG